MKNTYIFLTLAAGLMVLFTGCEGRETSQTMPLPTNQEQKPLETPKPVEAPKPAPAPKATNPAPAPEPPPAPPVAPAPGAQATPPALAPNIASSFAGAASQTATNLVQGLTLTATNKAQAVAAVATNQVSALIEKAKTLISNEKYQDALTTIEQLYNNNLTPEQKATVDGLKTQIQTALLKKATTTNAVNAIGGFLNRGN